MHKQENSGYANLSERARLVAEVRELLARHQVLRARKQTIPGYSPPLAELSRHIGERFAQLSESEQAAVADLCERGREGKRWQSWLAKHVAGHPEDAPELLLLAEHFCGKGAVSPYIHDNFGATDRPWRMNHELWK